MVSGQYQCEKCYAQTMFPLSEDLVQKVQQRDSIRLDSDGNLIVPRKRGVTLEYVMIKVIMLS